MAALDGHPNLECVGFGAWDSHSKAGRSRLKALDALGWGPR